MNEAVDTRAFLATEPDAPDSPVEEQEPLTAEEIRLVWQQPIVFVPAVLLAVLTLAVLGPNAHGIIGAALFLLIPLLIFPSGMGLGDVKLALFIGAMLGLDVIPALFIGFLSLWPVGLYLIATQGWSARKAKVPLGPSLAFGAIVVLLLSG